MAYLTPSDVRNAMFKKASFGSRGYDEEEVDTFLDQVEATISALAEEVAALRAAGGLPVRPVSDLGDKAVLVELDLIKQRLARIEAAVVRSAPPRDATF